MSSIPRFFVSPASTEFGIVTLPPEAAHHAARVLRLRPGERITLLDGQENIFHSVLLEVSSGVVTARIESTEPSQAEPKLRVTIAQALPKTAEKLEEVLQHGTEIGAAGFVIWGAQRSVARLESGDKRQKRLDRWSGIVRSAAEQSGRGVLPYVSWTDNATTLAATSIPNQAALILHESAQPDSFRNAMNGLAREEKHLLFFVGPEGGLTDDEVSILRDAGGRPVSLGPRILRTETAALVALAQALYARGE